MVLSNRKVRAINLWSIKQGSHQPIARHICYSLIGGAEKEGMR
jgi:hypothetical protein